MRSKDRTGRLEERRRQPQVLVILIILIIIIENPACGVRELAR